MASWDHCFSEWGTNYDNTYAWYDLSTHQWWKCVEYSRQSRRRPVKLKDPHTITEVEYGRKPYIDGSNWGL